MNSLIVANQIGLLVLVYLFFAACHLFCSFVLNVFHLFWLVSPLLSSFVAWAIVCRVKMGPANRAPAQTVPHSKT